MNRLNSLIIRTVNFLKSLSIQQSVALLLGAFVMLITIPSEQAQAAQSSPAMQDKAEDILNDDESNRPKTTREWYQEARETEGEPLERTKRIVEETADAVEDWAELYPDVAERSIPALQDDDA